MLSLVNHRRQEMGPELRRAVVDALESRLRGRVPLQVVLGPRQVGKTTAVLQVADGWSGPTHYASAGCPGRRCSGSST
jgi:predicted AAA+ superfamily ATPase